MLNRQAKFHRSAGADPKRDGRSGTAARARLIICFGIARGIAPSWTHRGKSLARAAGRRGEREVDQEEEQGAGEGQEEDAEEEEAGGGEQEEQEEQEDQEGEERGRKRTEGRGRPPERPNARPTDRPTSRPPERRGDCSGQIWPQLGQRGDRGKANQFCNFGLKSTSIGLEPTKTGTNSTKTRPKSISLPRHGPN